MAAHLFAHDHDVTVLTTNTQIASAINTNGFRIVGDDRESFARSHRWPRLVMPGESLPFRVTLRAFEVGRQEAALRVVAGTDSEQVNPVRANVVRSSD